MQQVSLTNEQENFLSELKRNYPDNITLIRVVERGTFSKYKKAGRSVRIKDTQSKAYMFSIEDSMDIDPLLSDVLDELDVFFVNNSGFMSDFQNRFPTALLKSYYSYTLLPSMLKPQRPLPDGFEYAVPDLSWIDFIQSRYDSKEFNSISYLTDRLLKSPSLGIVRGNEKIGIVLLHCDGETGPIIIDSRYRGRGLGGILSNAIDHILAKKYGATYALVDINNVPSFRLLESAGYQKARSEVFWGYLKSKPI
jgi:RimJ/RimL family protein N-acetyltransferase